MSEYPAGPASRRLALVLVAASLAMFLVLMPVADHPLGVANWFIPLYQPVVVINDLITATLLFGHVRLHRQTAHLVLACGYLYSALMATIHLLSFPGAFAAAGLLGGGAQTTAYLHVFWHIGFPVAVIAYSLLKDSGRRFTGMRPQAQALAITLACAAALALLAIVGSDLLPPMLRGDRYSAWFNLGRFGQWGMTALALAILFTRRSPSALDLWLMVVLSAWFFEIGLVAIVNAGRWDVGFYAGRIYALFASSFVLVMLLTEHVRMYGDLVKAEKTARSEARLRERQETLRLALQAGQMGVFSRDLASGITWWSPELEHMLGLAPHTLRPEPEAFLQYVLPEDRPALSQAMFACIEGQHHCATEFRLRNVRGDLLWAQLRGKAMYDDEGIPTSVFGVVADISAQHDAQRALRLADQRKDEFLATLAHELRNPLAPIRNAVSLMTQTPALPPQLERGLAIIDRQSRHLSRLVDDLLEVSRITQGKVALQKKPVSLVDCLSDALHAVDGSLQAAGHEVLVGLPDDPLHADADATRIAQCFLNLLNNAIKFTPHGGIIRIDARRDGPEAQVTISDTGIGIAPENLQHIFGLFSQLTPSLERSQGGLGIGLSLVKGFVELHGGSVTAASDGLGHGTSFTVRLPLSVRQPGTVADAPRISQDARLRPRRVLVVDDNLDAASSMVALLQAGGHQVREAHDGPEALRLANEFHPEVVLLDIGMPGMSGLEVARELRSRHSHRHSRIIAVTGWGQQRDRELTREAGFDFHLTKPVNHLELDVLLA